MPCSNASRANEYRMVRADVWWAAMSASYRSRIAHTLIVKESMRLAAAAAPDAGTSTPRISRTAGEVDSN